MAAAPSGRHNATMPTFATHASYDELPYEAGITPATHPQFAAVIARLFGLRPAPVERARVLEIGCGTGRNLLPMAYSLPGASFVGLDLSEKHITSAIEGTRQLGLSNMSFIQADIRGCALEEEFDYIICHGVYSWVPADAREAILAVCARSLAPHGVAHISYNAMPGWQMRGAFRDMLRTHARSFPEVRERVEQARAFATFLSEATEQLAGGAPANAAYAALIREESDLVQRFPDFYVAHEHLAEDNQPFYLLDFIEALAPRGLRYLGDARFSTMLTENLPRDIARSLEEVAPTREILEQYRDFLVNRTFRQSLVVRIEAPVNPNLDAEVIRRFTIRAAIQPSDDGSWSIPQAAGLKRRVESPIVVAILDALAAESPASLTLDQLLARIPDAGWPEGISLAERDAHLRSLVLSLFASDAVELRAWDPAFARDTGHRPRVFQPALLNDTALGVATPHHATFGPSPIAEWLIPRLDGERTRADLVTLLLEALERDPQLLGDALATTANGSTAAAELVDEGLDELRRAALLESAPRAPEAPR